MADLRALFSSNDDFEAAEAFTNRQAQWALVTTTLAEQLRQVTQDRIDVQDLEAPRTHVTVFHGVGGIGKTSLSRAIEAALANTARRPVQWGEPLWSQGRILPVRIDLARAAGTDFEQIILTIRLALAQHVHRPLPAFDLALRRYWDHNHPGEPLEEYVRRRGLAGKFGQMLPQQMQAALGEAVAALALPGAVGTAVSQITGALVKAVRERRQTVRALTGCRRFADLLEAEPDLDTLSYYPHLMAWELSQLPAKARVLPVILFDTFEDTGDRTHRDLERLLQRAIWLLPNAHFIITGRNRLQWADAALHGQLDYAGPAAWPGLLTYTAPPQDMPGGFPRQRQVLVGDFSPQDCDDYLARRLTGSGQPLIGNDIRAVIVERSHGLPLYLDLAVMRFLELRRQGRTPQPTDFDADFPAMITRTLSDLTPDERHVLRSVALLDAFDVPLATAAAGLPLEAPVLRLIERPFVRADPFALWPHHLHALIRSTLRTADDHTDDRWSPTDWHNAAERAHAALGDQLTTTGGRPDRRLLIGCLRQGLALARDFRLSLNWLTDAAWAYVSDSIWEPIAPPAPNRAAAGELVTPADALVELLSTLARRQHEHREHTAARLTTLTNTGLLPTELHEMALYYLAKAHRDLGHSALSRAGMHQVADGGGRLAPAARRGLAHLARLAGDFPTAHSMAEHLGWEGRQHRVLGDLYWVHGDMPRAALAYEQARADAEQHGHQGERAHAQTQLAFVTAFTDPVRADGELALAEQYLTGLELRATRFTLKIASLIRDAGADNGGLGERARVLRGDIEAAGLAAALAAPLELVLCFHHAVRGAVDAVAASLVRLRNLTRNGDYSFSTDIARFMAGLPLPEPVSGAHWLDGAPAVRERWHALVTARRASCGSGA
ncbi:ATP/GTP-binding protein [Streptomyces sp. NPDC020719]|uniref:ATP/GTP-binding protein n=1 Tax=Streptomyces sp. NPDC020719 TaxID=3154896 RepID=UPI0033EC9099